MQIHVLAARFVTRLKTRGRVSIRLGGRFFKVLFLGEVKKMSTEAIAREAHRKAPWCHLENVTNETLLATRFCGILTSRMKSGSIPTTEQCIAIARDIMDSMPGECLWNSVWDVIDGRVLDALNAAVEPALRTRVHACFRSVKLPVTGAHGDLNIRNVLVDEDGSYRILDWECFREGGSCIEDLCRLLGSSVRSSSDAGSDVRQLQQSRIMDIVEQRGYLTQDQCILLYILSQASCELEKRDESEVARRMSLRLAQALTGVPEPRSAPAPEGLGALQSIPATGA